MNLHILALEWGRESKKPMVSIHVSSIGIRNEDPRFPNELYIKHGWMTWRSE